LAAFGAVFGSDVWDTRCGRHVSGGCVATRVASQRSNGFQELPAVTHGTNADFLQVLQRKARENLLVYLVVQKCRLVSFAAQAPQPNRDVHGGPSPAHMIVELKLPVQRPRKPRVEMTLAVLHDIQMAKLD
jgi:hypothetical protein